MVRASIIPPVYKTTKIHNCLLIQLPQKLTVAEAPDFRSRFQSWANAEDPLTTIILDFGQTYILDSSGIGVLLGCLKYTKTHDLKLKLWGLTESTKLGLSLAGIESLFEISPHSEGLEPSLLEPDTPRPALTHPSVRSRSKRCLDIAGAMVGLGITGVLFVPIAIAIKVSSKGPIFFSQSRCGLMGKTFRMWKFRSMVANAESLKSTVQNDVEGALFKNANDPRITTVGKFLRKTSLDELPQFWNVLIGEMSLIGTRPPTLDELEQYEIPNWQRFDVKPGMSGEWQVNGRSQIKKFEDVIKLDLQYQENWSLASDLRLLLKTIVVIFFRKSGAV